MNNRMSTVFPKCFSKQIKWEKYVDPLETYDSNDNDEIFPFSGFFTGKKKILQTPMGILSTPSDILASNSMSMWIMHTNFDITPKILQAIKKVKGVEAIDILTRYRARIGFPNSGLFDIESVKSSIEKTIKDLDKASKLANLENFPMDIQKSVGNMIDILSDKGEIWAIFVLPNGQFDILVSDTYDDNYKNELQLRKETQLLVGGIIIQSDA